MWNFQSKTSSEILQDTLLRSFSIFVQMLIVTLDIVKWLPAVQQVINRFCLCHSFCPNTFLLIVMWTLVDRVAVLIFFLHFFLISGTSQNLWKNIRPSLSSISSLLLFLNDNAYTDVEFCLLTGVLLHAGLEAAWWWCMLGRRWKVEVVSSSYRQSSSWRASRPANSSCCVYWKWLYSCGRLPSQRQRKPPRHQVRAQSCLLSCALYTSVHRDCRCCRDSLPSAILSWLCFLWWLHNTNLFFNFVAI